MSNQEILEKAIKQAIAGGWNAEIRDTGLYIGEYENATASYHGTSLFQPDYNIIYDHDFAKALWGDHPIDTQFRKAWQQHLQQMVISDDPIKYLGVNI
jgi:hypothetical protein